MQCYAEETFGPVVSVYKVDSVEEAIERANDSAYGLNAAVISRDERKAVDDGQPDSMRHRQRERDVPDTLGSMGAGMGGMKDSGLGRRHGMEGMLKYTESQNISAARISPLLPLPYISRDANRGRLRRQAVPGW